MVSPVLIATFAAATYSRTAASTGSASGSAFSVASTPDAGEPSAGAGSGTSEFSAAGCEPAEQAATVNGSSTARASRNTTAEGTWAHASRETSGPDLWKRSAYQRRARNPLGVEGTCSPMRFMPSSIAFTVCSNTNTRP